MESSTSTPLVSTTSTTTMEQWRQDSLSFGEDMCDRFAEEEEASVLTSTPVPPIASTTMEQWKRANLKFRREMLNACCQDDDEPTMTPMPVSLTDNSDDKNESKLNLSIRKKKNRKQRPNKKLYSQIRVTENSESTPRLITKFSKITQDETEVRTVTESQQVATIKLKYLGLKKKNSQTFPDAEILH